jgi:hypothetical protein
MQEIWTYQKKDDVCSFQSGRDIEIEWLARSDAVVRPNLNDILSLERRHVDVQLATKPLVYMTV